MKELMQMWCLEVLTARPGAYADPQLFIHFAIPGDLPHLKALSKQKNGKGKRSQKEPSAFQLEVGGITFSRPRFPPL